METKNLFQTLDQTLVVNINGEIFSPSDAKISIFDRGFLFGDSVYEVAYSQENVIIFYDDHIQRLYNSASLIGMQIYLGENYIKEQIIKTLKVKNISESYIRVILTRGESQINLDPSCSFKNNLIIIVGPKPVYPLAQYQNGLNLIIVNTLRNNIKATNPNAKSGNYLNNVLAVNEAKSLGVDDAIMLNDKNEVTEGPTFNIWMIKDGIFATPPLKSGLLRGITREKVIYILKKNNLPFSENVIYADQLLDADEIFITSSTRGIMPISKINDKIFGNNLNDWPNIAKISKLYNEFINNEVKLKQINY